jgi:flagellar biosynthesis/type III secretory pathway M-ring protein FliF/YscJ
MDTIEVFQSADTHTTTVTEEAQANIKEANPIAIFVMGITGIFIFILFYIALVKVATAINQRIKKTDRK